MSDPKKPLEFVDVAWVNISEIHSNDNNPREPITDESVLDLKESIEEVGGVLVPLVVYKRGEKDYLLIDGERRWRASQLLSFKDKKFSIVPVNIISRSLTSEEMVKLMFNIHMRRKEWSQSAVAEVIGNVLDVNPYISNKELRDNYKLEDSDIRNARLIHKIPKELRDAAFNGDLDEYYLIYISSSLTAIEKAYPDIIEKYGWNNLVYALYKKIKDDIVIRTRDFVRV